MFVGKERPTLGFS